MGYPVVPSKIPEIKLVDLIFEIYINLIPKWILEHQFIPRLVLIYTMKD
jgi:hypothetical protein